MSQNPYSSPTPGLQPKPQMASKQGQSALGIASFVISVLVGLMMMVLVGYAGYLESSTPGGVDETATEVMFVGFGILLGLGMALVGLLLGIVGCVQGTKGKIFAIIGVVFNAMILLGVCGLAALGTMMG